MSFGFPHLVLALWLPLAIAFFFFLRPTTAGIAVVLSGMLFLPEKAVFDGPGIPPLGKAEISQIAVLLGCLFFARGRIKRARPGRGLDLFVLLLMGTAAFTVFGNREVLVNGPAVRPPLTNHDIISIAIGDGLELLLPFVLGRALVDSVKDARTLTRLTVGFGLAYSIFILLETRLSPQLHNWVYGYHAHDFIQTIRWGGYRPTVFMAHGLAVGLFALVVVVQACTRHRFMRTPLSRAAIWYVIVILLVCKSTGAIAVGLLVVPIALWSKPRRQMRLAAILATLCFVYPIAKLSGAFPDQTILKAAQAVSAERAASLAFRFDNERQLVVRAQQKLLFGWGGFARSHIYTDWGQDISVTDGEWIIRFGQRGAVGYFCAFAVLLFPIFRAQRALKKIRGPDERAALAGLALVVACYGFDLLPNGLFTNIPFFFAGALERLARTLPRADALARAEEEEAEAAGYEEPTADAPAVLQAEPMDGRWR